MTGRSRFVQIAATFVIAALVIGVHLHVLQVTQHDFWEQEAVKARTRKQVIPFRRGSLLDTHGRRLATTRTVWDLAFVFGGFRKGATAGQLLSSHYLLTGERLTLAALLAAPAEPLDQLASLTIGEMRALEPGARRADLLTYAAWLVGEEGTRELVERLRTAAPTERCCPELARRRAEILVRVAAERARLADLERALALAAHELVQRIDEAIAASDARVAKLIERAPSRDKPYETERQLHKEEDYRERLLVKNVAHGAVFDLAADPEQLPGIVVLELARRVYPQEADVCAQLIGKVGPPSDAALAAVEQHRDEYETLALSPLPTMAESLRMQELEEDLRAVDVRADEEVGKEGLEALFEPVLRGRRGFRRTENDRSGRRLAVLDEEPPLAGRDVTLTLDAGWQAAAESVLARGVPPADGSRKKLAAACVLLELPDMAVRVLATSPSPPREELRREWERLKDDTDARPLHPRTYAPYLPPPPGSSFKPLLAAVALSAGLISPATSFECSRDQLRASPGGKPVKCEGFHGAVALHEALVKSCNHYFAQLADHAGSSERVIGWARRFGFGAPTGFCGATLPDGTVIGSLPEEVAGTAEVEAGRRNLMILGMGQGKLDVTPLQMAAAMGALALRRWQPPTLIERVGDAAPLRREPESLPISEAAWEAVVAAMRAVTESGGTAGPASPEHPDRADLTAFDLATKTGTPQQGRPTDLDHSWFVGFFPAAAPRFAFALFVERSGRHGGDAAAPLLHALFADPAFAELAALARKPAAREVER